MALNLDRIFFPTDFSENAQKALALAVKIASLTGSKLILFHTIYGALDRPDLIHEREKSIEEANQQFDQLISDLREEDKIKDLEILTILQSGPPVTGLLEKAREHKASLIVMGTKGASGNRNVIFGSVASNTIIKSEIPVLAVPPGGSIGDFKHITFVTDYHEGDLTALKRTVEFAERFKSRIEIIHIAESDSLLNEIKYRGFRELVREKVAYKKISFEVLYDYDFSSAMTDYFAENPHSLLVMIRYERSFWKSLIEINHTKEMVFYTKVPLLVLIGSEVFCE